MRLYCARKRLDGRWDFTVQHGADIRPTGYCTEWLDYGDREKDMARAHPDSLQGRQYAEHCTDRMKAKHHTHGHATAEEAVECYRRYEHDNRSAQINCPNDEKHRCQFPNCDAWTQTGLRVGSYTQAYLCDEHRTPASFDIVHPPVVGETWES